MYYKYVKDFYEPLIMIMKSIFIYFFGGGALIITEKENEIREFW